MATEIERKFLVLNDGWRTEYPGTLYRQGYLSLDKEHTVRVRTAGNKAWLNVKGLTIGISRAEFEYEIPLQDAEAMLAMCTSPLIEKIRYIHLYVSDGYLQSNTYEIDEFLGDNAGLVVAEIELISEDSSFFRPSWLGAEVSDDPRYYNANLINNPYNTW